MGRREDIWNKTWAVNPTATNRFDNYDTPFNYNNMSSILDQIYDRNKGDVIKQGNMASSKAKRGSLARLSSQGITGGSTFMDYMNNADADILDQTQSVLGKLGTDRMSQSVPLMQMENQNKFNVTQAGQSTDFQNIMNELRKMGILQGQVNDWEQMDMQRDAQPGFLDDLFSGLGLAAQVAGIPTGKNTNVLTKLFPSLKG